MEVVSAHITFGGGGGSKKKLLICCRESYVEYFCPRNVVGPTPKLTKLLISEQKHLQCECDASLSSSTYKTTDIAKR